MRSKKSDHKGIDDTIANGHSETNSAIDQKNISLSPVFKAIDTMHPIISKLHHSLVPILLLLITPNIIMLLFFSATYCHGSYACLIGTYYEHKSAVSWLLHIWLASGSYSLFGVCFLIIFGGWGILTMLVLPGLEVTGPITPKGNIPRYKDNGFLCYISTMIAFCVVWIGLKFIGSTPSIIYEHYGEILGCLNMFSLVFCVFLCIKGIYFPSSTDSGSTGNLIFDYYWGTELYPRIGNIDVKVFTNCRFGMTLWAILVVTSTIRNVENHGFVDCVIVSNLLQILYITKFFWWEAGYYCSLDIIQDRGGYYICWGCLTFIPGLYCSVALYMSNQSAPMGATWSCCWLAIGLISLAINYAADRQRQYVRACDGKCLVWGKKPQLIRAKYEVLLANSDGSSTKQRHEGLLLVSGWWGISRHFHYLPELTLSFSWCCAAGMQHLFPFTYFIWLVMLLTHRSVRDDRKCRQKYGQYWDQYCAKVPYRILPYIF